MPAPLSKLPWDLVQDQLGVKVTDFIGVIGKVLLRAAQDQIRAHVVDCNRVTGTHGKGEAKDQMRLGP